MKFLGGAAKNGINARQLRRRCLRMALPLTRLQSEELFLSIANKNNRTNTNKNLHDSISVHRFLLGLFPHDYEASLTDDLSKQQTLMGLSEIDRANQNGVDWNLKKKYDIKTMRFPPAYILTKLQSAIVKRGGTVADALKKYQIAREEAPGRMSKTNSAMNRKGMRELIQKIYRIPASDDECDLFLQVMCRQHNGGGGGAVSFVQMFRSLEGGTINSKNRFVTAAKGISVSDRIGHYDGGKKSKSNSNSNHKNHHNSKNNKNNKHGDASREEEFDDTASWVSLASTRAPSLKRIERSTPRSNSSANSSRHTGTMFSLLSLPIKLCLFAVCFIDAKY